MCGIAGIWVHSGQARAGLDALVGRMADSLIHRGPDDAGTWIDPDAGFALGYRRLAIVDITQAGHQPMESASGRWVIAFNGEIYNFAALRRELDGAGAAPRWRGHSDTEVLLAAIDHWGLEHAIERSVGMFAIALWDRRDRVLHLARDRMGEKPLYYGAASDAEQGLSAHVWVRDGDVDIVGGEIASRFAVLATFPPQIKPSR